MDGIEDDVRGQAAVVRLDLLSGVGREAASLNGVKTVPTTLLFDGTGQVVLRESGLPDRDAVRAKVAELAGRP